MNAHNTFVSSPLRSRYTVHRTLTDYHHVHAYAFVRVGWRDVILWDETFSFFKYRQCLVNTYAGRENAKTGSLRFVPTYSFKHNTRKAQRSFSLVSVPRYFLDVNGQSWCHKIPNGIIYPRMRMLYTGLTAFNLSMMNFPSISTFLIKEPSK